MAQLITEEQILKFKEFFDAIDTDGDGRIHPEELGGVMQSLGYNPSEIELKAIIDDVDKDKSGFVDFNEFLVIMSKQKSDPERELQEIFQMYDKDNDGCITFSELKDAMRSLGESLLDEEVIEMIRMADLDRNGVVTYEEFRKFMTS